MTTTDLLERARSASSLEEECAVIWEAVQRSINEPGGRQPLSAIIGGVRAGHVPRPVLLGVVAALVPETYGWRIDSYHGTADVHRGPEAFHFNTALALLIAKLEASHG